MPIVEADAASTVVIPHKIVYLHASPPLSAFSMPSLDSSIVEVAVCRPSTRGREYLILQRAHSESLYPGLWQIVSGKVRTGETAVQAARREVMEETGLRPHSWWTVAGVNAFYSAASDVIHLCPLFVAETDRSSEVRISREHQAWQWLERAPAQQLLVWPSSRRLIEQIDQDLQAHPDLERWTRLPEE